MNNVCRSAEVCKLTIVEKVSKDMDEADFKTIMPEETNPNIYTPNVQSLYLWFVAKHGNAGENISLMHTGSRIPTNWGIVNYFPRFDRGPFVSGFTRISETDTKSAREGPHYLFTQMLRVRSTLVTAMVAIPIFFL